MNTLFQKTNAYRAKYSEYEYRQGDDGNLYITPKINAVPSVYDPMKVAETLVLDALNVGRLAMKRSNKEEMNRDSGEKSKRGNGDNLKQVIHEFVSKYGLLGFMTALPTTPEFMNYDAVYLPKNHFIREETMTAQDYLSLFYPFEKPNIYKDKTTAQWNVCSDNMNYDRKIMALSMTFSTEPMSVGASLLPIYAEHYDWLVTQFRDWAFMLVSAFLFYEDGNKADDLTRDLYRQGVSAFGSRAPTYHVALYDDKPTIVWDFYSLLLTIQTMFGFALTDETRPLRICRHCNMAFAAEHASAAFCSPTCKNQHNVYKNRDKKKQDTE